MMSVFPNSVLLRKLEDNKAKYILKCLCSVACPTHSFFLLILPQWCSFVCRTLYIKVIHEWLGLSPTLLEARQLLCATLYGLWLVEHSTTQRQQWPSYVCATRSFLNSVTHVEGQCHGRKLSWTMSDCTVLVHGWRVSCWPPPAVKGSILWSNTCLQYCFLRSEAPSRAEMGVSIEESSLADWLQPTYSQKCSMSPR